MLTVIFYSIGITGVSVPSIPDLYPKRPTNMSVSSQPLAINWSWTILSWSSKASTIKVISNSSNWIYMLYSDTASEMVIVHSGTVLKQRDKRRHFIMMGREKEE